MARGSSSVRRSRVPVAGGPSQVTVTRSLVYDVAGKTSITARRVLRYDVAGQFERGYCPLLDDLPPFVANSQDVQAAMDVICKELGRIEAARVELLDGWTPEGASARLLPLYESMLGLAVAPANKTLDQRRTSVVAFLRKLRSNTSGVSWQDNLTRLIGGGWTYEEHDPNDGGSPAGNVLRVALPFQPPLASPTGLSGSSSGSGSLPAGTHHYCVTAVNTYGETLPSSNATAATGASGRVALNWNDVAGAVSYNVYRGTSSGDRKLVASGITTSDYLDAGGQTPGVDPPTTNTTESFEAIEARRLARDITPAHLELAFGYTVGFILNTSRLGDTL